jgi:hypothetical protein
MPSGFSTIASPIDILVRHKWFLSVANKYCYCIRHQVTILPFDRDNNLTYINIGRGILGNTKNIIKMRAKYMI